MKSKKIHYRFKLEPKWHPKPSQGTQQPAADAVYAVQGKKASLLEWAFARALDKIGEPYIFSYLLDSMYQIPGQSNQIDFLVGLDYNRPFEIDGEIAHKGADARAADMARDQRIDEMQQGVWENIVRVDAGSWTKENAEEKASQYVQEKL